MIQNMQSSKINGHRCTYFSRFVHGMYYLTADFLSPQSYYIAHTTTNHGLYVAYYNHIPESTVVLSM